METEVFDDAPEACSIMRSIAPLNVGLPTMRCRIPNGKNEEAAKLGLMEDGQLKGVFYGSPTFKNLILLVKLGATDTRIRPGEVSVDGYLALMSASKCVRLFSQFSGLATKRTGYPTRVDKTQIGGNAIEDMPAVESLIPGAMNVRVSTQDLEDNTEALKFNDSYGEIYLDKQIPLPIPLDDSGAIVGWSLTAGSRDYPTGRFFPYFPNMMTPDRDYVGLIIGRLFFRCFGDSLTKSQENFNRIRLGLRQAAPTMYGMMMSHAFIGISLAEMGQMGFAPIIQNKEYLGFVLAFLPGKGKVVFRGQSFDAQDANEIQSVCSATNSQQQIIITLKTICLSKLDEEDLPLFPFPSQVSSRSLYWYLHDLNKDEFNEKEWSDIEEAVKQLVFVEDQVSPAVSSITTFLKYVRTRDRALLSNFPAFLQGNYWQVSGRIAEGLAIFGARVPSLSYGQPKDNNFPIPPFSDHDPNLVVTDKKRRLEYLPFQLVAPRTAIGQWDKLLTTGNLRIPPGRNKTTEFTDSRKKNGAFTGDAFVALYQVLKETIAESRKGGEKRKRINEDGDGNAKRQKKNDEDRAMNVDDF